MIGGINQDVQAKMDAYRGNPQALAQQYSQSQQLIDLLALQKLKSEKESAAREMQLKMGGGEGMPTVAESREKEVLDLTKQELAQQTAGTMQTQQAQQQKAAQEMVKQQAQQPPIGQGLGGMPAPNIAPQAMAAGGIVAFQSGGEPEFEEFEQLEEGVRPPEPPRRLRNPQEGLAQRGIRTLIGDKTPQEVFAERQKMAQEAANYSPEERAVMQRQIDERAALDSARYNPDQRRSEALTRFLLGAGGRSGIGSVLGGAGAAAVNYQDAMDKEQRASMVDRQKQEAGLMDMGPASRAAGMKYGTDAERTAMTGLAQGTGDAMRLMQLAQQAAARGNPAEEKKYSNAARQIVGDSVIKAWSRSLLELEKGGQQNDPQYNDLLAKIASREQQIKAQYGINDPVIPIANPNSGPAEPEKEPGWWDRLTGKGTPTKPQGVVPFSALKP
jgi:hypothetical protein